MYISWKKRTVVGGRKVAFLLDEFSDEHPDGLTAWKPLWCEHRGAGLAWTPLVVRAERRGGKPRQKLEGRLPTIRCCCIADPFARAAWWYDVDQAIKLSKELNGFANVARDERAIRAKLAAVVPPPTRAGRRDFATYRLWREREQQARWAETDPVLWRAAEEAARRPDEAPEQARRRADDERRRYEQARHAAEASARRCADCWGRRPPADSAVQQKRTCRAKAHWARFEQAVREQEARSRRWSEGQARRRGEEARRRAEDERRREEAERSRAEEQWRRAFEELLGRPSRPPWYEVLGLSPTATISEIKRRYRELAKRLHPDREGGVAKLFVLVKDAYDAAMNQAVV
jgi:hypothetical protein